MKNKVKEFRTKLGLSQKELAKLVETSQQQIQRIEVGMTRARLDLATDLAAALSQPLNKLFPGSERAIKVVVDEAKSGWLPSDSTFEKLGEKGVELDSRTWYLKFLLRGHTKSFIYEISGQEKRRLFGSIQDENPSSDVMSFVVFETQAERIAVNLAEMVYCHFLFEATPMSYREPDEESEVNLYFCGNQKRMDFRVEPDDVYLTLDEEMGEFNGIFFDLESFPERHSRLFFEDEDGEDVFLRVGDIALLIVPLWIVEPENLEEEEDISN